ncbi:MAG TPA: hypothetical protein VN911_17285, partial [Candidatus Acidoferrum sp.]|nr:hypothetical protein [Candidatus Acidoferrum sp.]
MTSRCTCIFAGLLIASCFCVADSRSGKDFTVAEYHTELDQLLVAAQQLDSSGRSIPPILKDLPPSWRVRTEQQDFEISTEGLQQDV